MNTKLFYRIDSDSLTGLWYNKEGLHTGLIHKELTWLGASSLTMPFEPELVGYISVTDSLEHLYTWFPKFEILKLQELGFSILEYSSNDVKFYDFYQHNVIHQKNSVLESRIKLH